MNADMKKIEERRKIWESEAKASSGTDRKWVTVSSAPIDPLYTPEDNGNRDFLNDVGYPGQYPYTRGVHASMYRGRMWTMRQFSGMGTPEETNQRYHMLLKAGQHGLSVAFDLPTLMGFDSDHERSLGEVGKCGVAVDSLLDMEIIFNGIDTGKISTSMTINAPANILLAMYLIVAEKKGVPFNKLRGTLQNDILKEYIAQKEWIYPPEPSIRLITDIMGFCADHVPQWNTISVSGYHIREAGATAAQELAYTLADGFTYVEAAVAAGLDVDDVAPRISYFFNAHIDFFEEIAKYRAARRIFARRMREKYGAKKEESWKIRFHTQTAGCSLTAQQPELNLVRTATEALSAILGGTQSLHTNSMDETLALPSDKAARLALRTQQVLAHETGVANTIDPLAGSYFVEALTDRIEEECMKIFDEIDEIGGVLRGIEEGYFQREIAKSAYIYQRELDKKERITVGVNDFILENEKIEIPVLLIDGAKSHDIQAKSIEKAKGMRDNDKVKRALADLTEAAAGSDNTMPHLLECVRCYATEGEMVDAMKIIYGEYIETPII
ncbi:MAG: methylmalonyl-CoA mutase [candidate division Zixibacteria bacterium]|nr:methylmalonyl-CoA mutase [candidate division Zixibacteria bacterium]MBU1471114.1 methylmalonyl-CoA mutase [candidate division Zixibacteria bacterium]MBU2624672.1 methylmalonyl-CoA mutase [candidate division Zixibacteria bacterium]